MLLCLRMYAFTHTQYVRTKAVYEDLRRLSHTHFCKRRTVFDFCSRKKADELGLGEIAVTDHGFASTIFHMTLRKWQNKNAKSQT